MNIITDNTLNLNQRQVWSETDDFSLKRYDQFINYLPRNAVAILDVGCNTGRGGALIKQKQPHRQLWGIDLVEDRIRRVPNGVYEQLLVGSATDIEADDNSFDAIVAGEFVEHVPAPELSIVLSEFYRVLRPNGRVLLTTPNPTSLLVNIRKHDIFADPSHVNIMAKQELVNYLHQAGFVNTQVMGSGKVSHYLGDRFPLFNVYGSYLTISDKV